TFSLNDAGVVQRREEPLLRVHTVEVVVGLRLRGVLLLRDCSDVTSCLRLTGANAHGLLLASCGERRACCVAVRLYLFPLSLDKTFGLADLVLIGGHPCRERSNRGAAQRPRARGLCRFCVANRI